MKDGGVELTIQSFVLFLFSQCLVKNTPDSVLVQDPGHVVCAMWA